MSPERVRNHQRASSVVKATPEAREFMNGRHAAKFVAGLRQAKALTHGAMAAAVAEFTLLGITYSPRLDATATIVWTGLFVTLAYFAWIRRSWSSRGG